MNYKLKTLMVVFLFCAVLKCEAWNVVHEASNEETVCRLLTEAVEQHIPDNQLTLFFARKFIGCPYVAHTLEINDTERLVVNVQQFDCTTFVETVVALTLCAQQRQRSYADFTRTLTTLRYRAGRLNGYTSRLHYFSDWIRDNEQLHLVREVSQPNPPFSGVSRLSVNYMSRHPQAYKALKAHPEWVSIIERQEQDLNRLTCRYIPKRALQNDARLRAAIHDGDVLALTTSANGLDISHVGFAVWQADGLHLLNASMRHGKVEEDTQLLRDYLQRRKTATGVRVVRILSSTLLNS